MLGGVVSSLHSQPAEPAACQDFRDAIKRAADAAGVPVPAVVCSPGAMYVRARQRAYAIDVGPEYLEATVSFAPAHERAEAMLGVAAHELGHFAAPGGFAPKSAYFSRDPAPRIEAERVADKFAGDLLRKMGVSTAPFRKCLAEHPPSDIHPSADERIGLVGRVGAQGSCSPPTTMPQDYMSTDSVAPLAVQAQGPSPIPGGPADSPVKAPSGGTSTMDNAFLGLLVMAAGIGILAYAVGWFR